MGTTIPQGHLLALAPPHCAPPTAQSRPAREKCHGLLVPLWSASQSEGWQTDFPAATAWAFPSSSRGEKRIKLHDVTSWWRHDVACHGRGFALVYHCLKGSQLLFPPYYFISQIFCCLSLLSSFYLHIASFFLFLGNFFIACICCNLLLPFKAFHDLPSFCFFSLISPDVLLICYALLSLTFWIGFWFCWSCLVFLHLLWLYLYA